MKTWSRKDIYKDENTELSETPEMEFVEDNEELFTEEFLRAALTESDAVLVSPTPLTDAQQRDIAYGLMLCPDCSGAGGKVRRVWHGQTTGIIVAERERVDCQCRNRTSFWRHWDKVEPRWKAHSLESLIPFERSFSPLDEQAAHLETLRANPTTSAFLVGPTGTGKTCFLKCLYRKRLEEWSQHPMRGSGLSVWSFSAEEYLSSVSLYSQNPSSTPPVVTPELIRKLSAKGLPIGLFIDEVDKFDPSKGSKLEKLFSLLNTAYECNAQIAVTCNKSLPELANSWLDSGRALIRRIGAQPDGITLNFTKKTPKVGQ
jgi:hypothetical protein